MGHRFLVPISALAATAAVLFAPSPVAGQANRRVAAKTWAVPHTANGQPDLQGLWTNATITPFERPKDLAGKEFFTEEEAAAYEKRVAENSNRDRRGATAEADVAGAYNDFWFDRGNKIVPTRRTSLVIDPPDGKVPPLTAQAQKAAAARTEISRRPPWGPEDMGMHHRCLLWPTDGLPQLPSGYNNNYQILQVPGYVVILVEMIHDVRIIPLDGRPHLPPHIRQWLGDSRGRWDGSTLVVDTTNFTDKTHFRGADQNLHLIERFTRVDPNTILYEFTVDDPAAFTKPWKAQAPLTKTPGPMYEYACHEGNYSMVNVLKGARTQELGKE